jgi:hypothetical protein
MKLPRIEMKISRFHKETQVFLTINATVDIKSINIEHMYCTAEIVAKILPIHVATGKLFTWDSFDFDQVFLVNLRASDMISITSQIDRSISWQSIGNE